VNPTATIKATDTQPEVVYEIDEASTDFAAVDTATLVLSRNGVITTKTLTIHTKTSIQLVVGWQNDAPSTPASTEGGFVSAGTTARCRPPQCKARSP
jgi:hypothetical protein